MKKLISAVIVTHNEENNIRECLESVKWVDEIIIIDMFSSDKTINIAKDYTSKIYYSDGGNSNLVVHNKNIGIKNASGKWIIIIDADERVSEDLRVEIIECINKNSFDAFLIRFQTYFLGKPLKSNFLNNLKAIRLFRKTSNTYYSGNLVHDQIYVRGVIGDLKQPIIHLWRDSIAQFLEKTNIYTTSDANRIYKNKKGGVINRRILKINLRLLILEPFIYLIYIFIRKGLYKDGMRGLILSILFFLNIFIERAKVWEIYYKEKNDIHKIPNK